MTSRVELEIDAPHADVAELMADPRNNTQWMDDVERIEPIKRAHRLHMESFKRFTEGRL